MKFETSCSDQAGKAYFALEFLREAYKNGKLQEIENIEYVFDCLDISSDLEYTQQKLKEFHIDF